MRLPDRLREPWRRLTARARGRTWFVVAKRTVEEARDDGLPAASAALAFYVTLSLVPLVLFALLLAGLVWGEAAASGRIVQDTRALVGEPAARAMQSLIAESSAAGKRGAGAVVAAVALLYGGSRVFAALDRALNRVWDVERGEATAKRFVKRRLVGALLVLAVGVLVTASFAGTAALALAARAAASEVPFGPFALRAAALLATVAATTVLLALVYRYLPEARVPWRAVWSGALATSIALGLATLAIATYAARASVLTLHGSAEAVLALLVWVYVTSAVVLAGAELTVVLATRFGEGIEPRRGATRRYRKALAGETSRRRASD